MRYQEGLLVRQDAKVIGRDAKVIGQDAKVIGRDAKVIGRDAKVIGQDANPEQQDVNLDQRDDCLADRDANLEEQDGYLEGQDACLADNGGGWPYPGPPPGVMPGAGWGGGNAYRAEVVRWGAGFGGRGGRGWMTTSCKLVGAGEGILPQKCFIRFRKIRPQGGLTYGRYGALRYWGVNDGARGAISLDQW
ncbi:MAG: hypothetical protein IPP83_16020 [Flavobacteriales bacterium]|nr:hypothetical protein [Flavobacteriales bacterium]